MIVEKTDGEELLGVPVGMETHDGVRVADAVRMNGMRFSSVEKPYLRIKKYRVANFEEL